MVGNDFSSNKYKEVNIKRPVEPSKNFVFQEPYEEQQYNYHNGATLAFSTPVSSHVHRSFVLPRFNGFSLNIFTKTRILYLAVILILVGITAEAIIYKQQIIGLTSTGVTYITQQISHESQRGDSAAPAINPRQLTIYTSNYDNAITDIMTQPITITVGSISYPISGTDIASWVSAKKQGSLTTLSVNSSELTFLLNQMVRSAAQKGLTVTSTNAAYNQIANNLLKAKGMTVTLPT